MAIETREELQERINALNTEIVGSFLAQQHAFPLFTNLLNTLATSIEVNDLVKVKANITDLNTLVDRINSRASSAALVLLSGSVDLKATIVNLEALAALVAKNATSVELKALSDAVDLKATITALEAVSDAVNLKATTAALTTLSGAVALKASSADLSTLSGTVDSKASSADLSTLSGTVNSKAATTALDTLSETVALKASSADLSTLSGTVDLKATITALVALAKLVALKASSADLSTLSGTVDLKATITALEAVSNAVDTKQTADQVKALVVEVFNTYSLPKFSFEADIPTDDDRILNDAMHFWVKTTSPYGMYYNNGAANSTWVSLSSASADLSTLTNLVNSKAASTDLTATNNTISRLVTALSSLSTLVGEKGTVSYGDNAPVATDIVADTTSQLWVKLTVPYGIYYNTGVVNSDWILLANVGTGAATTTTPTASANPELTVRKLVTNTQLKVLDTDYLQLIAPPGANKHIEINYLGMLRIGSNKPPTLWPERYYVAISTGANLSADDAASANSQPARSNANVQVNIPIWTSGGPHYIWVGVPVSSNELFSIGHSIGRGSRNRALFVQLFLRHTHTVNVAGVPVKWWRTKGKQTTRTGATGDTYVNSWTYVAEPSLKDIAQYTDIATLFVGATGALAPLHTRGTNEVVHVASNNIGALLAVPNNSVLAEKVGGHGLAENKGLFLGAIINYNRTTDEFAVYSADKFDEYMRPVLDFTLSIIVRYTIHTTSFRQA